jgi:hypothetical protein
MPQPAPSAAQSTGAGAHSGQSRTRAEQTGQPARVLPSSPMKPAIAGAEVGA